MAEFMDVARAYFARATSSAAALAGAAALGTESSGHSA